MPRVVASLLLLALPLTAAADCLPPLEGRLEVRGEVASCKSVKAPRPSREPFLRVELSRTSARVLGCDDGSCLAESLYTAYASLLEESSLFFVPASSGATCQSLLSHAELVAELPYQCCDTFPHRGKCALGGPILLPVANEF